MRIIGLDHAVSQIAQTIDVHRDKPPYFFMTGAGISVPSVSPAYKIILECASKYEEDRRKYPGLPEATPDSNAPTIDLYSYWLSTAYPNSDDLVEYLRGKVENAKITAANLRLAHLLMDGRVAKTCFTTNFDDLLTRAIDLFGGNYIVCDHPRTTQRVQLDPKLRQVIHIHGTYRFYDCVNLKSDITKRAKDDEAAGSSTMLTLLRHFLHQSAPIVIGYAGWEQDVFMTALRRRLVDPMPFQVLWFQHERSELDKLPDWLTTSEYVTFVCAEPSSDDSSNKADERKVTTLAAQLVLEKIIEAAKISPPNLTREPFAFFADKLSVGIVGERGHSEDPYGLANIVKQIELGRALEKRERSEIDKRLEPLREAMRSSDTKTVVDLSVALVNDFPDLPEDRRVEIIDTLEPAVARIPRSAERHAGYIALEALTAPMLTSVENGARSRRINLWSKYARASIAKDGAALNLSIPVLEAIIESVNLNDADPEIRDLYGRARLSLADALEMTNGDQERVSRLRKDVVSAFANDTTEDLVELASDAEMMLLRDNPDLDDRIVQFTRIIERLRKYRGSGVRASILISLGEMAGTYIEANKLDEAINIANEASSQVTSDIQETAVTLFYLQLEALRLRLELAGRVQDANTILDIESEALFNHPALLSKYRIIIEAAKTARNARENPSRSSFARYRRIFQKYRNHSDPFVQSALERMVQQIEQLTSEANESKADALSPSKEQTETIDE